MVIAGELLEDGDLDLTFPDRPPDLDPETLFEIEIKAVEDGDHEAGRDGISSIPR